jgi:hypothetical protein
VMRYHLNDEAVTDAGAKFIAMSQATVLTALRNYAQKERFAHGPLIDLFLLKSAGES